MNYSKYSVVARLRAQQGFTLIEVLVVVIILGVLASLVVPRLAGRTEEARITAAQADIEGGLSLAVDMFEADNGKYPEKLDDLVSAPASSRNWKGPYLKKGLPRDPWGQEYVYRFPGVENRMLYDLFSLGPDGESGTSDDIVNWKMV